MEGATVSETWLGRCPLCGREVPTTAKDRAHRRTRWYSHLTETHPALDVRETSLLADAIQSSAVVRA